MLHCAKNSTVDVLENIHSPKELPVKTDKVDKTQKEKLRQQRSHKSLRPELKIEIRVS